MEEVLKKLIGKQRVYLCLEKDRFFSEITIIDVNSKTNTVTLISEQAEQDRCITFEITVFLKDIYEVGVILTEIPKDKESLDDLKRKLSKSLEN